MSSTKSRMLSKTGKVCYKVFTSSLLDILSTSYTYSSNPTSKAVNIKITAVLVI